MECECCFFLIDWYILPVVVCFPSYGGIQNKTSTSSSILTTGSIINLTVNLFIDFKRITLEQVCEECADFVVSTVSKEFSFRTRSSNVCQCFGYVILTSDRKSAVTATNTMTSCILICIEFMHILITFVHLELVIPFLFDIQGLVKVKKQFYHLVPIPSWRSLDYYLNSASLFWLHSHLNQLHHQGELSKGVPLTSHHGWYESVHRELKTLS